MADGRDPRILRPGEAIPLSELPAPAIQDAGLYVSLSTATGSTPDLVALLSGPDGKVRTDDDLIFYNNTASTDGAISWQGRSVSGEVVQLRCAGLEAGISKIVFGCAAGVLDEARPARLALTIRDTGGIPVATAEFETDPTHRAMILLEIYRRADHWRCRLLAQGYLNGLADLVTDFGVQIEHETAPEPTATQPAPSHPLPVVPQPQPGPAPVPVVSNVSDAAWQPAQPGPVPAPARGGLFTSRRRQQLEAQNAELTAFIARSGALDNAAIAAERDRLAGEIITLTAEARRRRDDLADLDRRLGELRTQIETAEGEVELQDVGVYRYRHRLDDAVAYRSRLEQLRDSIRTMAKPDVAVTGTADWTVNGSRTQGRAMVREVSKLMLRAYNADVDHAVRTMRPYKLDSALARLDTTRSTITRLGKTMSIQITDRYHSLRRNELELTADYLSKVEEEKDRQRELREQARENRKVEEELARKQAQFEKEQQRYAVALDRLEAAGDVAGAAQIRNQLTSVNAALAGLAHRRENLRLGHVYVISNLGAFGHRMVKIGMTRRLEPEDRIRELGDASVPFKFDQHALILSEDAVELEAWLHRKFRDRAVNRVNTRREFFYVTPAEVRDALAERGEQFLLEFNEVAEAAEWHQSAGPERAVLPS